MSRFDRHPVDIQIKVKTSGQMTHTTYNTVNLSVGGLGFHCDRELKHGDVIKILIPFVSPPFETQARVAWSRAHDGHFEIGVEFLAQEDAFMTRMVEQVCHIENYKKNIYQKEGRVLSPEEAAQEWIRKYASKYPSPEGAK
jgi:hypothetical protein